MAMSPKDRAANCVGRWRVYRKLRNKYLSLLKRQGMFSTRVREAKEMAWVAYRNLDHALKVNEIGIVWVKKVSSTHLKARVA